MCGIAGIITTESRPFDYKAYCTLGCANDERGGDSCGICIDGTYQYGVNKDKLFRDFFVTTIDSYLMNLKKSRIALVHCRKASVGAIDAEHAQPILECDKEDKIDMVVMHNGTISNYRALADKYLPTLNTITMTDSQVMAKLFVEVGFDVLAEYKGGAVFAIVDYREGNPITYLFKGASYNQYSQLLEERPLYYTINDGELMFSSMEYPLYINRPKGEVFSLPYNQLLKFNGEKLEVVKKVDRAVKPVTAVTSWHEWGHYDYSNRGSTVHIVQNSLDTNILTCDGKPIHGNRIISSLGYTSPIYNTSIGNEYWFFNGVPVQDRSRFNLLCFFMNHAKMKLEEFSTKYINMIRYLSLDPVYYDVISKKWKKATGIHTCEDFSGEHDAIFTYTRRGYQGGVFKWTTYGYAILNLPIVTKDKADIKKIKKECLSMMS